MAQDTSLMRDYTPGIGGLVDVGIALWPRKWLLQMHLHQWAC